MRANLMALPAARAALHKSSAVWQRQQAHEQRARARARHGGLGRRQPRGTAAAAAAAAAATGGGQLTRSGALIARRFGLRAQSPGLALLVGTRRPATCAPERGAPRRCLGLRVASAEHQRAALRLGLPIGGGLGLAAHC